ncbi:MAG TPA: hypothetical protein H9776_08770 [Candidatus Mediterraneibacter intestinipullorum]|nr:hypothetical protein [Candidatus Mediterraneibacter intestinipullorum]
MAMKKRITKKMAKEIFRRIIGIADDNNIENLSDRFRDEWKITSGIITVYCAYESAWSPIGIMHIDGEYIEVTISTEYNESKIYINPETLEEDPIYTYKENDRQWRRGIADYLQERCLAVVSEEAVDRERVERVEI